MKIFGIVFLLLESVAVSGLIILVIARELHVRDGERSGDGL